MIRFLRNIALDKHNSCLCPELKFWPCARTGICKPFASLTKSFIPTFSKAIQMSSSEYSSNGSKFLWINNKLNKQFQLMSSIILNYECRNLAHNYYLRSVPENNVGSWGIIDILDRSTSKLTEAVFMPSTNISPSTIANRKTDAISDDLPAPVLPTQLIFSFGRTENVRPRKTGSQSIA